MAGGKKAKRGGAAKKKQPVKATPPVKRNTAFIETEGGPERVLPREIRDTIYRYLLLGCNVKQQRKSKFWKTDGYADYYRFEVSILRLSKNIYTEARDVLYRENAFVVLSTKELAIEHRLRVHAVPVISQNTAAIDRFTEHSLFLRFEGPLRASPAGDPVSCKCEYCTGPPTEKRFLLLSDDGPAFIRTCRALSHMDPDPTFDIIDSPRGGEASSIRLCKKRTPSFTTIEFRSNSYGPANSAFVEQVLSQFKKVTGDRRVEIIAPSHPKLAAQCKKAMTPKVVWSYAMGWDLVEVARELKAGADEMLRTRTIEATDVDRLAMMLYDSIFLLLGNSTTLQRLGGREGSPTHSGPETDICMDWSESWSLLNLDMAIASVYLNLFSGSDAEAKAHAADALKFVDQSCHAPPDTVAHLHHSMAFLYASDGRGTDAVRCLRKAQVCREIGGLGPDAGLDEDMKKQIDYMANCKPARRKKDNCLCICCSSFAGKSYEAQESAFGGSKPAGIVGWLDLHHQLTAEDLEAMGISKQAVPPRLQVEVEAPACVQAAGDNTTSRTNSLTDRFEAMRLGAGFDF